MPYIANTEADRRKMLQAIGVADFEELLRTIPPEVRWNGDLPLPEGTSELEVTRELEALAAENRAAGQLVSFLGAGTYDHFIPGAVAELLSRSEFYTAYTPYQAEVSQGTLQSIFEFQTMICQLTGMDVANASVYDAASGMGEAALMAHAATGRNQLLVAGTVHPFYLRVLRTYIEGLELEVQTIPWPDGHTDLEALRGMVGEQTAAVFMQHPNFLGILEPLAEAIEIAQAAGALAAICVDPISLGLLKPPGELGADIVLGEGQALGIPANFGGPHLGFFACRQELLRRLPGRLAGQTTDRLGNRGFVLTLQTREQHIRREKATSNICTNHALNALAATIYMSLMGRDGIRRVADLCLQKSHYAQSKICDLPGFELRFPGPFFKEFTVRVPGSGKRIVQELIGQGVLPGVDLGPFGMDLDDCLLVAVTERRTKEEIDHLIALLEPFAQSAA